MSCCNTSCLQTHHQRMILVLRSGNNRLNDMRHDIVHLRLCVMGGRSSFRVTWHVFRFRKKIPGLCTVGPPNRLPSGGGVEKFIQRREVWNAKFESFWKTQLRVRNKLPSLPEIHLHNFIRSLVDALLMTGKCKDGSMGTPCCGVGTCDAYCCNCEGGCR